MVLIALLLPVRIFIFTIWLRVTPATVLKCFKHYPNYYLSKNGNLVVVNISSITSCLDHCLKSQLLYEFICRSAMVNRIQRECVLSKWSPNLAIFNRYQSNAIYTEFYQNICLSPWDQISHFTVAPPRTTFSVPTSNKRLLISNSDNRINKNYELVDSISDITVNSENKKKPLFKIQFHRTQHISSSNTANESIHRPIKLTEVTVSPNKKTTSHYADYDEDRSNYTGNNKNCDNSNNDDNDDYYDGDDNDNDDDDGDNGYIYDDDSYKDSDPGSDTQPISANKDITYPIDGSLLIPVKSAAIRPSSVVAHRNFQSPLVKIDSTVLFPSATVITPSISVNATTDRAHISTTMTIVTVITTTITTTTNTTKSTTTTTANVTSTSQFIPFPIGKLVPEWNTTTKDSELSIQHQNYTLNIGIIQQSPENREMIRNGLIEELKCFHHFANNRLNDYGQEIIKQIGLQDCLHNCILRVAFLCLSVNYNKVTMECILNGGNRIINNVQLISSASMDYYEYICLSARKQESKAKNEIDYGNYNITKLRKCFSICENAVMYTLNGLIVDNIYTPLECLMACDTSDQLYKARCYSVNWFKDTRICYLHTAKTNISDLKVTTSSDFFLNNCAGTGMTLERSIH